MIDCDLSHDAVMKALIQPNDHQPVTDYHVTCLVIDADLSIDNDSIAESLQETYDTSLERSWDGHLIESNDQIDGSSSTDDQSNRNQESASTATASHSKESEITFRNSEESDEELVDLMQNRPLTLFESLIDDILDNIQPTSPSSNNAFEFCFKYFGQALKETNLTFLDLGGNKISSDLFFDFVKHLKGTQIATLNLPMIDYSSGKSVTKGIAACSSDDVRTVDESDGDSDDVGTAVDESDITLVDSSCNEKGQRLELLPTILKDTQISSLDFSKNPIDLKILSSSLIGSKITVLGLRQCGIEKDCLICLARILKDTQIASIDLSCNKLDCKSLKIFAAGLEGTKIKSLNLSGNVIGVEGINCLGNVLKNTQITSMDISCNELYGDDSLEVFVNCLVESKITSLCLNDCDIGVCDLKRLGSVLKNTQITSISIGCYSCESLKAFLPGLVGSKINSLNLYFGDLNDDDGLQCLGNVLKNTQITSLAVSKYNCHRGNLEVFAPCLMDTKITCISLKGIKIDISDLKVLGHVLKNSLITSIYLSRCTIVCDIQNIFALCLADTKITCFGYDSAVLKTDDLQILGNLLKDSKMRSIQLRPFDSKDFEIFAPFLIRSNITSLNLSYNYFDLNMVIKYLVPVLKNTKITSLELVACLRKCDSLRHLVMCLPDTKITSLNLSDNHICCNYFYLAFVLKHTQITSLNISYDSSRRCDPTSILQMLNEDNNSLDLSNRDLCNLSLCYLARISKNKKIISLNLSWHEIDSNGLKYLSQGLLNSETVELNLSSCNIDFSGAYYLAQVLRYTRIKSLNLSCSEITCEGLKYLAQGIVGSQIASLDLSENSIKDEGAKYLAQGIVGSQIASLDLSENYIKDEGAMYLAQGMVGSRIASLNLRKNYIKDEGAMYLAQGMVGSRIASLNLRRNSIKDEGAKYLAECLADIQIVELDLRENMIGFEAAYQLFKSVCQKKVESMQVGNVCLNDIRPYSPNLLFRNWSLFRYPGCFIEINTILEIKEGGSGRLINNTYRKSGITKLIFTNDYPSHLLNIFSKTGIMVDLKGLFVNINITEIEFERDVTEDFSSILEKSNIAKLKIDIDANHNMLKSLLRMRVIALHFELSDFSQLSSSNNFKSVLSMDSDIVYLDLSYNLLNHDSFERLVEVLKGSKIISLDLSNNRLEAGCVELLASVLPDTKLTYIDVHDNEIGYKGFKYLLDIARKTSICWLSLGDNNIEEGLQSEVELSPYIVPRDDTPIEFQIRYLFRELVTLNTASEQFEFIVPREDSVMTIKHYARLVKHLLDTPIYKMHIYDYFYMQNMRRHDIHVLNRINVFINEIQQNFTSFFENKMMQIAEKFGFECFLSLVEEFDSFNLTDFVEFLLMHRVLYYVDDDQNFLHPFIYKMMHKYKMPLFSEVLEPNKKQQIISYFEEHCDIDAAREIIDLLK